MTDLERRILLRLLATGCLSLPWLSPAALAQGSEVPAPRAHRSSRVLLAADADQAHDLE